jgi:capsid protein
VKKNIAMGSGGTYTAGGFFSEPEVSFGTGTTGISGRREMQYDRDALVQISRELYRKNPIYYGMVNTAVDYIIGTGHKLQCISTNKRQQKTADLVEDLWNDFMFSPEIRGMLTGDEMQAMVMQELLLCGDTAAIKIAGEGKVQLIESEQIAGRKTAGYDDGIKTDSFGRILSFNVCPYKSGYISVKVGTEKQAQDVIFLASFDRPSDVRAMPVCQASFPMIHRIDDVCNAEAIAWQTLARFAVAITAETARSDGFQGSVSDATLTTDQSTLTDRVSDLGYALLFNGKVGEKIEGISRNIPGKDFPQSIRTFLRLLGLPMGLPLELTFLDWTESNYSQSRAVLEHCKRRFARWQRTFQQGFLDKLLEWKLRQWIAEGKLSNIPLTHSWIGPAFPWLDPLKEAEAMGKQMELGISTLHEVLSMQGKDYDAVMAMREREVDKAVELVKKYQSMDIDVPIELFCGLPYPNKSSNQNKSETKSETSTETETDSSDTTDTEAETE